MTINLKDDCLLCTRHGGHLGFMLIVGAAKVASLATKPDLS